MLSFLSPNYLNLFFKSATLFHCFNKSILPLPRLLNNEEVKEAEDVKINFDGKKYTLERIACDPEHSGEYTCSLKNKIKQVTESGQVTVFGE